MAQKEGSRRFFQRKSVGISHFYITFAVAMEKTIRHDGVVERIEGTHIQVRILQTSACAGCKIAGHCTASESKEKVIDVRQTPPPGLGVGDSVVVCTSGAAAGKALLLGFGVPLLLLLAVLAAMLALGQGEGAAALGSIAVLIPYYITLWLCRDRIGRTVAFKIEG